MKRIFALILFMLLLSVSSLATVFQFTGFEDGSGNDGGTLSGTGSIQSTTKRTGSYALRINPTTTGTGYYTLDTHGTTGKPIAPLNTNTVYTRFYFRIATAPASAEEEMVDIQDTVANIKIGVTLTSGRVLKLYRSTNGTSLTTLLNTGSTVLSTNTWYRIEVKMTGATTATCLAALKIDGTAEFTSSSWDDSANQQIGAIDLGKVIDINGKSVDFYYDDFISNDSGYPGAGQSVIIAVNGADGNYANFTAVGQSSKWDCVDEVPTNSDTDYVQTSNTQGQKYSTSNVSYSTAGIGASDTINCVKMGAIVKRDNASFAGSLRVFLRSGSTDGAATSAFSTGSAYEYIASLASTDPATGSAWTVSAISSVQPVVEERSTTRKSRITTMFLFVDYTTAPAGPTNSQRSAGFFMIGVLSIESDHDEAPAWRSRYLQTVKEKLNA